MSQEPNTQSYKPDIEEILPGYPRQGLLNERLKKLAEVGLDENHVNDLANHECSNNLCALDLASFGIWKGRVVPLRKILSDDGRTTCGKSFNRTKREKVYAALPDDLKQYLPNKGLMLQELIEDEKLEKMTPSERASYIAEKERRKQEWLARFKDTDDVEDDPDA